MPTRSDAGVADALKLEDNLSYRLSMLNFLMGKATQRIYSAAHLTAPQWKLLSVIDQFGPIPASEISTRVTLDKTAISRAVRQLYQLGLALWKRHDTDMRSVHIFLTPKGKRAYARMNERIAALQARLLADVSAEQVHLLFAVLSGIEEGLRAELGPAAKRGRKAGPRRKG